MDLVSSEEGKVKRVSHGPLLSSVYVKNL